MLRSMKHRALTPERTAVALAGLLLFAVPARAETPVPSDTGLPPEIEREFHASDLDRSGGVTLEEARSGQLFFADRFGSIDQDGNGIVTLYELAAALAGNRRRWLADFDAADTDRDGVLSEEELAAAPPSVQRMVRGVDAAVEGQMTRDRYESTTMRQLYESVDLPVVVPNLFEKRF
jgi:hypothetical protein